MLGINRFSHGRTLIQTLIDRTAGTAIGNMTSAGGLAAAYDDNLDQSAAASATTAAAGIGTIGKDWGAGVTKTVSMVEVYGANNHDLCIGANPATTVINVYATTDGTATGGTLVGTSGQFADGTTAVKHAVTLTAPMASRSIYVEITDGVESSGKAAAEIRFYEDI